MGNEARINDALRRLGEEFRLGMVPQDEYRARRRQLLESWGERDVTTAPGLSRIHRPDAARETAVPATATFKVKVWIGIAAAIGLTAAAFFGWSG